MTLSHLSSRGATAPPPQPAPPASRGNRSIAVLLARLGPLIGLIFVVALFSALRYDTFFTVGNFELILRQTAVVGIAALGMTLIIISGGIDLSVGSAISLVCVCIALFMPHYVEDPVTRQRNVVDGVAPLLAALGGILVGVGVGVVNGTLITGLRIAPFIITLGMMSLLRGAAQGLAGNTMVYPVSGGFLDRMLQPVDPGKLWLLTPGVWLMAGLALLVSGMLRYTRFGRHVFAIGSNEQTARLCGVPVARTKLLIYVCASALVAARRRPAVLLHRRRRPHHRRRAGARHHRRRRHRRGEPVRRPGHRPRQPDRCAHHDGHRQRLREVGPGELGPTHRHRRDHRRRGRTRPPPQPRAPVNRR